MRSFLCSTGAMLIMALFLLILPLSGAYLTFMPTTVTQPDGTRLECFASGDEYHNWLHDKDGYTIIQNPSTGYYTYAMRSGREIAASELIAGRDNPTMRGLVPNINISREAYRELRNTRFQMPDTRDAPTTGTINNLVVFIRFSGEAEFGQNISTYDGWFNSSTSSQKGYFQEASYGQLTVNTTFYPAPTGGYVVSWQDSHARGYFQPYNASTNTIGYQNDDQRTDREFDLLEAAIAGVGSAVPADLVIDSDNDGQVDNVVFIVSGSAGAWSSLLWPHRWSIYDRTVTLRGKRVYDFNFQLKDFLAGSNVGVICHEFFHTLGAPDLYHYNESVFTPVGSWDLMENNTNPPQHMGAFMKWKYGDWIDSIPVITNNGTYTLNPLTSPTNNCYRINSPSSSTEYFVVEYRRKTGTYENSLPGSGLLIYRINTTVGEGNAEGPPDEVYLYRPGGTTSADGTVSSANYSSSVGRTAINATTNPTPFLTSGAAGGLDLSGIGAAGTTISFTNNGGINAGTPTCTITSPADEAVFNLGESITVNVTATDSRSVSRVEFYLDGSASPTYTDSSSPYSWVWNTTSSTGGVHTIMAKVIDNQNLFATDQISISLLAPAHEGFETGNFSSYPWSSNDITSWTVQTAEKLSGSYAAKSGTIGNNAQTSLSLNLNINTAGNISFYQKTSSETDYDFLKFYIDGVEQGSWSGEVSWTLVSFPVTAGLKTFTWIYSKDVSVSSGSDCAWLDHIIFPPHAVLNPPTITWNPSSITQELLPNATASQTLQIGNSGDQTLNYTCSLPSGSITILDESFENAGSIPTGWAQENVSGDIAPWIFATGGNNTSNPSAAYDGTYNARLYKASSTASITRLMTRELDLSGAVSASLNFWHTQALWSPDQDELRVYYRTSSSGSWTLLASYTNSITTWTEETISLPNLTGTYQIGFEGTAKYGYGVCLDKVVVTAQMGATTPWITLNGGLSASGSIADGGANQTITIGINSTGLNPDTYNSTITVTSNSATNSSFTIPVALTVLAPTPEINVSVNSLAFGTQMINTSQNQSFQISNTGTATLSGNISTPAGYTVALTASPESPAKTDSQKPERSLPQDRNTLAYTVGTGATKTFTLTFTPTAVQAYNGNVTITHNAAGNSKTIALSGQGGKPTIGFSATSFSKNLAPGQTDTNTLTLSNSGNLALNYSLAISGFPTWLNMGGNTTLAGSIAAGASAQDITLSYNATGLAPGNYSATIVCSSNDPATLSQNISVALTVRIPIAITAPNTGYTWPGGALRNISFDYSGTGSSVELFHSFDNGNTWSSGTVINVVSGTNTYGWIVPNNPSTTCKIKLVDSVAPNAERISNVFTISAPAQPLITITAPTSGVSWEIEESYNITWTHLLLHPEVELFYSLDNGSSWSPIATVPAADLSYSWLCPATPSSQAKIRIWDAMDHNSMAISNLFALINPAPPSIPQDLTISYLEGNVTLSWSASTGNPTGYRIYRSSGVDFLPEDTELVETRPATETSITIPASTSKAFYRVIAYRN